VVDVAFDLSHRDLALSTYHLYSSIAPTGSCRSQGIPAILAKTAIAAAGGAVVASGNVVHCLGRSQFGHSVAESGAELVIKGDFHRQVLEHKLASPHRLSKSFLGQQAMGRKLEDFALVGAA
jgi:hypothetical protein